MSKRNITFFKKAYKEINKKYFKDSVLMKRVYFSRQKTSGGIRYGTHMGDVIQLHPILLNPIIPDFFVKYIIYHEMLHEYCPPIRGSGYKWRVHHPKFLELEKKYKDYFKCLEWEHLNYNKLLKNRGYTTIPRNCENGFYPKRMYACIED